MKNNLLIPKKKCPVCNKKQLRKLKNNYIFCPNMKCKSYGEAFPNYSEINKIKKQIS